MRPRVEALRVAGAAGAAALLEASAELAALTGTHLDREAADRAVATAAGAAGLAPDAARAAVFTTALAELTASTEAAESGIVRLVRLVAALAPVDGASAWRAAANGAASARILAAAGSHEHGLLPVAVAVSDAFAGKGARDCAATTTDRAAALLARPLVGRRSRCRAFLELALPTLQTLVERDRAERTLAGEATAASAAERRLVRLGLDLHDGPTQTIAALAADARVVGSHVEGLPAPALMFVEELVERLDGLGVELRDVARSLEPRALVGAPLDVVLGRELDALRRRTGAETALSAPDDFSVLTAAEQLALVRVVQEALANVREHSGASTVVVRASGSGGSISVEIEDDGRGFEIAEALERAARRGRLGLAGMRERLRPFGGSVEIASRPGGPTRIRAVIPQTAAQPA